MPSDARARRAWPEGPSELTPYLPLVYVAWADGHLDPDEIATLRDKVAGLGELSEPSRARLNAWMDTADPPSASELNELRTRMRSLVPHAQGEPVSLADFGLELIQAAGDADAPAGTRATLSELEALLGVHGGEALQALQAPRPPAQARPAPERSPSRFAPSQLHRYLDGDEWKIRQQVLNLLMDPGFRIPFGTPTAAYRERVLELVLRIAHQGLGSLAYPVEFGGKNDVAGSIAVFETLAYGDLSVLIKFGVQFGLFGGSILNLGTRKHHERYLPAVGRVELPGCYGMSESRHGSNVREVETTVRYDADAQEFVVDTPHPLARKDWLGNAAEHGRMATVFAQLQVGGEGHGVHAFLVPIRDEQGAALPGIEIEDCGHKVGLNGVDNGRISFDEVRIPRDNLLDRFATVSEAGEYDSPIASEGKRFFTMLGTLVAGRVSIAAASLTVAKRGLAVAVRYSDQRRQFGPESGPEVPILDYLTQQRALLPRLATTYGLHFAIRDLIARYAGRAPDDGAAAREIEVMAAGLKAAASWHTIDTLQVCREACGGKGYLSENLFGRLRADTDVFTTFEGANVVLLQLVAKGLLTRYRHQMGDLKAWGIVRFIAEAAGRRVSEFNPVSVRRADEKHLRDPDMHRAAFEYREERLLSTAARRLKARIDEGVDTFHAMNEVQDHLVELALAHVDGLIQRRFVAQVEAAPEELRGVLTDVYNLYALSTLERHRAWYLEAGYMESTKTKAIRAQVNLLCGTLREDAVDLVDAFGIPDTILAAPAAFVDES